MSLTWPWMTMALLLLPLLVGAYLLVWRRRKREAAAVGAFLARSGGTGRSLGRRRHIPPLFFLGALTLLMLSLSRPNVMVALPRIEGTVILAFDVSKHVGSRSGTIAHGGGANRRASLC